MVRPAASAAWNVIAGWLGLSLPSPGKQRNATRAGFRKTARRSVPRLVQRLEAAGCQPRQVAPDQWFALCPTCRSEGRHATVEIRRAADGTLLMVCSEAHERKPTA